MEICYEKIYTRHSMKQELIECIDKEELLNASYKEDYITEIADGLVPIYNAELVDFCCHFDGSEYWELWSDNKLGYETPLDILRGNLYCLYNEIAHEILNEMEEE
tara:strand:+ start:160 stop:474 length:315 start_codon:yes stop_codon:yes gene_type:complete